MVKHRCDCAADSVIPNGLTSAVYRCMHLACVMHILTSPKAHPCRIPCIVTTPIYSFENTGIYLTEL